MQRRTVTRVIPAAITTGLAVAGCLAAGQPATAVPAAVSYTRVVFGAVDAPQPFTVPDGVTSIGVHLWGGPATRFDGDGYPVATWGGSVAGQLAVTPGQVLYVLVGGPGAPGRKGVPPALQGKGGWNGGGDGGSPCYNHLSAPNAGSGGGGATDIRVGGVALTDRVAVAGGAGGAGTQINSTAAFPLGGAGGASVGAAGGGLASAAGKGGSQTAGGAAGSSASQSTSPATPGSLGVGGHGEDGTEGCMGGGGGGYYGGGGGAGAATDPGSGGGGGSNLVDRLTDPTSVRGDSSVVSEPGYRDAGGESNGGFATITYAVAHTTP